MKVPIKWLKEYIDITIPLKELAERLTMAGTEVSILSLGCESWEGVVIGCIEAVEPHPNADRLRLVTVGIAVEKNTVVCGHAQEYLPCLPDECVQTVITSPPYW